MSLLKRVLYLQATAWTLVGLALAIVPRFSLVTVFGQVEAPPGYAWVRIAGAQLVGFAMLLVLVAQSIEDRWWWSWTFAIVNVAIFTIAALYAVIGLPEGSSSLLWWLIAAVELALTLALLWGMAKAGTEQPPDIKPDT